MTAEPRNESVTARIDAAWGELLNVDDRTSPEEYPDMCLITRGELAGFMERPAPSAVTTERYDIVDYLRQGGERINGVFHGWDSEMAGYALAFADMIEAGKHQS